MYHADQTQYLNLDFIQRQKCFRKLSQPGMCARGSCVCVLATIFAPFPSFNNLLTKNFLISFRNVENEIFQPESSKCVRSCVHEKSTMRFHDASIEGRL